MRECSASDMHCQGVSVLWENKGFLEFKSNWENFYKDLRLFCIMKSKGIFIFALILVFGLGLVLAEENSTNNETGSNETDFNGTDFNETDLNETDVNETDLNETDVKKDKAKRGLGQVIRGRVRAGIYTSESGETFRVRDLAQNRMLLLFGENETGVETGLEIEEETENGTTKLKVKLKNGRSAEVKIMPSVASQKALERLRLRTCSEENNCSIELREFEDGAEMRLAYEIQLERHSRILGIFKSKMNVRAQVDAENGEVLGINKPWWAWLATEPAEE